MGRDICYSIPVRECRALLRGAYGFVKPFFVTVYVKSPFRNLSVADSASRRNVSPKVALPVITEFPDGTSSNWHGANGFAADDHPRRVDKPGPPGWTRPSRHLMNDGQRTSCRRGRGDKGVGEYPQNSQNSGKYGELPE